MGLLNFDDPQSSGLVGIASGLLGASGASRLPISLGQAMGMAAQQGQQAYKDAMQEKHSAVQEKLLEQQLKMALQKDQLFQDYIKSRMGVSPVAASATGLSASSAAAFGSPELATASQVKSAPSVLDKVPTDAIMSDYLFNGGKNIGEWAYKQGVPDMQVSNGYAYDKNNLKPGFIPQANVASNGQANVLTPNAVGGLTMSMPAGALDVYGAYRNADEAAKAGYDPTAYTPPGGKPVLSTRKQIADAANLSLQDKAAIAAYNAAGRPGPNQPFNLSVNGLPLQSEEEKARTAASVDVDKTRALEQQKKGQGQENLLVPLQEIKNRLRNPDFVLGNSPADRAKMVGHNYGLQTRATINTQRIRELGNQLTLANGSLGAGVSNADRDAYEKAQGRFNEAKSYADMVDAADTMERIANKYIEKDDATQVKLRGGLPSFGSGQVVDFNQLRK